jgi:hypothetical protein
MCSMQKVHFYFKMKAKSWLFGVKIIRNFIFYDFIFSQKKKNMMVISLLSLFLILG